MKRITFDVGTFGVNCSILAFPDKVWIIDPGQEPARILETLAQEALVPSAILLTHAHFDHIGAIPALQARFPDLPVYAHPADTPAFEHPANQLPPDYPAITKPKHLHPASELGGVTVIETPGHTPGGVCYHFPEERLLFSGDTLFAGSIGRTDLPGGDMSALMRSLEKLKALDPATTVIPGHGDFTTIREERQSNPFLR